MEKLRRIFSPDWFKLNCFLMSLLRCIPFVSSVVSPYLKLFHAYALLVLAFDFLGERRILRNKGRFLLVLFVICYTVTLLSNSNLINISGLSDFGYLLMALSLVYSYGQDSNRNDKITGTILCLIIGVFNLIGIWMFYTKFFVYHVPTGSFIGMYIHENRLCGLWGNPAVQGMIAFIGLCLSSNLFFGSGKRSKVVYLFVFVVNFVTMLLANARAAIFSFTLMCAVYTFLHMLKGEKTGKKAMVSGLIALSVAVLVFCGCKVAQQVLTLVDVRYEYYLHNIDEDYILANMGQPDAEPPRGDSMAVESGGKDAVPGTEPGGEAATPGTEPDSSSTIDRDSTGLNGRGTLWIAGVQLGLHKPLFGHGLNNLNYALPLYLGQTLQISGNLHNVYIDLFVACGLSGLLCLVVFLLIMLGNAKKYFRYSDEKNWERFAFLIAAVAGFMLYGMVDSAILFSMYPMAIAFWYIFAQLAHLLEEDNKHTGYYRPEILSLLEERFIRREKTGKRVCFVNDSLDGGGAEQILLNVANALDENGYEVTILTLWADGVLEGKLNPNIVLKTADPFDSVFLKRIQHWVNRHFMPKRLYNILYLDQRYDYTVAFLEGLSTRVVSNTRGSEGSKKYAWVHIDFINQNWTLPFFRSLDDQIATYRSFDKIFCVSEAVRDAFIEVIGYEEKTVVQHNLVDTRGVCEKAGEQCPEERLKELLLCSVGRLNTQKGYDRLIRVFARILEDGINCTLWILGEGRLRRELEEQVAQLGLGDRIRLLGFQKNPFCYVARADVFVCSSRAEGYSTVITEALLLGKPIVSTLCAGVREQLGNDEYGIVTQNDEDALYEGLQRMLRDENLREHYAVKAQERGKIMAYDVIEKQFLNIFS